MLPQGRSELDRIVDVDGSPLITANAVYAASFQGRLSAIRPTDGTVLWERDTSSYRRSRARLRQRLCRRRQERDHRDRPANRRASRGSSARCFERGLSAAAVGRQLSGGRRRRRISARADARRRPSASAGAKIDGDGIRSRPVVADDIVYCMGNGGNLVASHRRTRSANRRTGEATHAECDRARRSAQRRQVDAVQSADAATRCARRRCAGTDARSPLRRRRVRRRALHADRYRRSVRRNRGRQI